MKVIAIINAIKMQSNKCIYKAKYMNSMMSYV